MFPANEKDPTTSVPSLFFHLHNIINGWRTCPASVLAAQTKIFSAFPFLDQPAPVAPWSEWLRTSPREVSQTHERVHDLG